MDILTYILSCFYFFLPAYFVNMTPPLAKRAGLFNFLDKPLDFGKKFLGEPIFGSHKTWRGAILGVIAGLLIALIQVQLYQISFIKEISFFDYQKSDIFLFGFLISFGAVFGDLLFAFIKRRLKVSPGARFLPFDQTNYVIGAFLFFRAHNALCASVKLDFSVWLTIFTLTFFLHIIVSRLGYLLGWHNARW